MKYFEVDITCVEHYKIIVESESEEKAIEIAEEIWPTENLRFFMESEGINSECQEIGHIKNESITDTFPVIDSNGLFILEVCYEGNRGEEDEKV